MSSNTSLAALNDDALLSQFGDLVRQDREGKANLLRHIDAIDRRKLWAKLGHPCLWDFLVSRRHMSESTAYKRIGAARTARLFPVLLEMVGRGEIHLSGIHRLKAHLTHDNHLQVLAEAKHKTTRQIEALVARLAPRPDVPTTLRALPNRTTIDQPVPAPAPAAPLAAPPLVAPTPAAPVPAAIEASAPTAPAPVAFDAAAAAPARVTLAPAPLPPRRDPEPEPLAPGRYKLTVTISESTRDKLKQLEDLLAQQIRKGDTSAILDRALDALLTEVRKRKLGMTAKPRSSRVTQPTTSGQHTRHVRASVRREVWRQGEGRCGFVGEDGHRCNETRGLQFAHKDPWAKGGENTAENLGLRCPAHKRLGGRSRLRSQFHGQQAPAETAQGPGVPR